MGCLDDGSGERQPADQDEDPGTGAGCRAQPLVERARREYGRDVQVVGRGLVAFWSHLMTVPVNTARKVSRNMALPVIRLPSRGFLQEAWKSTRGRWSRAKTNIACAAQ